MKNRKRDRLDPAAITAQAQAAREQLRSQQPRVNTITSYLERRKDVNGFGRDFEWTLTLKGEQ